MSRASSSAASITAAPVGPHTSSLPRPPWLRAAGFRLVSPDRALALPHGRTVVVGSASAADLRVEDEFVSARHLRLQAEHDAVHIEDLGSKNGTFVDGVAVDKGRIRAGARIRVGRVELELLGIAAAGAPTEEHHGSAAEQLLGRSRPMEAVRERLARLAPLMQPVLVCGETGTGKELAARILHERSLRHAGPFVAINCGSIPEQLAESELFGHRRGAFTGAHRDRVGAFGRAAGGTLFLDEIGELPPLLQAKLLRTLETAQMLPVGAEQEMRVDVRIVAATHRDLRRMVVEGRMREDLYHRLAVLTVELPPLRERREDIPQLVTSFAAQAERELRRPVCLSPEAIRAAQSYSWPGNVRALKNAVLRAVALGDTELQPDVLEQLAVPPQQVTVTPAREAIEVPRGDFETMKRALLRTVVTEQGSIRQAAALLGIPRSTLGSWLVTRDEDR